MVNCSQVVSAGKIRVESHVDLVLHMIGQINFTGRQELNLLHFFPLTLKSGTNGFTISIFGQFL